MKDVKIRVWVSDEEVCGLMPLIVIKGRDSVQLTLNCGSEIILKEQTLRRALASIEAHREEYPGYK